MINQKSSLARLALFFTAVFLFSARGLAADKPAADSAKLSYPLTTCVVSDDKLEESASMGGPVEYIYKQAGKPDRLVLFCCKDCIKDFNKDPAKYLQKLDAAVAAKAKDAPSDHKH